MAPHSITLSWKSPWMEKPGRLQPMGLRRVGPHWATSLSLFTCMHWRRKWQATPVFLPGESQGRGSLVGCRLWGRTESDTTEATSQQQQQHLKRLWDRLLCPSPYRWGNWDSREVTACSWGALWDRSLIQVYLVPGSKFAPLTFSNLKCGPFHDIHLHDLEI